MGEQPSRYVIQLKHYKSITMMKKLLILTIALLSMLSAHAQKKSLLDYQEIQLGKYADGRPMLFHFIPTDGELKLFLTVSDQHLMLMGDNKGCKLFDTETFEEIAEPNFKGRPLYQLTRNGYLSYSQGKMFLFGYGQPVFYNFNGEKVWSSKYELLMADRPFHVVICAENRKGDHLIAYDMETGKTLWRQTIARYWHDFLAELNIDKSVKDQRIYYLMGDSLIRLNVVTGDTLRHAFTAGVKEPVKSRFSLAKARYTFPSRDFTQEALNSDVYGPILTGTHSNIIFSGDTLFVTDAKNIYCLDKNLKSIWASRLPEGCGSKSTIKIFGDQICMQNYGIAFQGGILARYGHPFTATFDRNTGKQLSLEMIDIKKKVMGGIMVKGRTYWQTDNQFFYNEEGDSTVHQIKWKPNTARAPQENHFDYVICDTVGVNKDGILQNVITNDHQLVLEVYGQDVNVIKDDGTCDFLSADSVFFSDGNNVYSTNNDINQVNTFIIVDPKTRKIESSFHLKGSVGCDKNGNIYVVTKSGVGFHKKD